MNSNVFLGFATISKSHDAALFLRNNYRFRCNLHRLYNIRVGEEKAIKNIRKKSLVVQIRKRSDCDLFAFNLLALLSTFDRLCQNLPYPLGPQHLWVYKTWDSLVHLTKSTQDSESIKGVKTNPIIYILTDLLQMRKVSNFRHQITAATRAHGRLINYFKWNLKSLIPICYIREAMEYHSNRLDCLQFDFSLKIRHNKSFIGQACEKRQFLILSSRTYACNLSRGSRLRLSPLAFMGY